MVSFIFERNIKDDEVKNFLVVDYKTGKLIDATRSFYILSDNVRSPMAYNIVAFENPTDADKFFKENGGKIMNWAEVIDYTRKHSGR
jgi:copper chaperone NosL